MDCANCRERILEGLDCATHVASCPACASFASLQAALDAALASEFTGVAAGPGFAAGVQRRVREAQRARWRSDLPEALNVAGAALMIAIMASVTREGPQWLAAALALPAVIGAVWALAALFAAPVEE